MCIKKTRPPVRCDERGTCKPVIRKRNAENVQKYAMVDIDAHRHALIRLSLRMTHERFASFLSSRNPTDRAVMEDPCLRIL